MFRDLRGAVCMCAALCILTGCASSAPDPPAKANNQQAGNSNPTVAYIYVSNNPNPSPSGSGSSQIIGYASDSNGQLTAVPGSPFNEDVGPMATNGHFLMAAANQTAAINAYNIHSDGSLAFATQTNYSQNNQKNCGAAGALFFDHTNQLLYVQEYRINCASSGTASYAVDSATGRLNYLGNTITGSEYDNFNPAAFLGNNQFAYSAGPPGCYMYSVDGFQRASNGLLSAFSDGAPDWLPGTPGKFAAFVPDLAAADTSDHIAIVEIPANPPGCADLPASISTWTADANGKLTTTSTYANMPTTSIVNPSDLKMDPSGQLLAIAGEEGLQVLHMNGANPVTSYTPLLTSDPINMMFWDNSNHLYAISKKTNKLHVFTITNAKYQEATGSPYAISSPNNIAVQPWPAS